MVKGDVNEVEEGYVKENEGEYKDSLLWQKSS